METGKLRQVDSGQAGDGHGADTVEECIDKRDRIEAIGCVENSGSYERSESKEENMEPMWCRRSC